MKKVLLALLFISTLLVSPAFAADQPAKGCCNGSPCCNQGCCK